MHGNFDPGLTEFCGKPALTIERYPLSTRLTEDDGAVLLLPPDGSDGYPLEPLTSWHRARGGVTLLVDDAGWTGVAAVDRSLVAGTTTQDDWTLARLHALTRPRGVMLQPSPPPAIAFLDRDGTIMEDRDYLADPEGVVLLPGAASGLRLLAERGVRLAIVSNQSGVGSGRFTLEQLAQVNARLLDLLNAEGVTLDGIYCCIHRADAGCECRKPGTGLVRAAEARLNLDASQSVVVGDKPADLGLARALGVPAFLVTTGYGRQTQRDHLVQPDYVVDDLAQFARICCDPGVRAIEVDAPAA